MKLGTLKHPQKRDGELLVVSQNNERAVKATAIAPNLREALENWKICEPKLQELFENLMKGSCSEAFTLNSSELHSPLPRCFQWIDGSAFIHHVKLVRMARGAPLPEYLETVPLMYQGGSDSFLPPLDDIPQIDFQYGTDFEGEVGVILDDVPMGVSPKEALKYIRLFVLINDVSLRGLIPEELKMGFGFFQGKPSTAFAPFAVTADELGGAWKEGRIHLPLDIKYNESFFGKADGGEMHFCFGQLISHAARTRELRAGTILGSGTVSNEDMSKGSSCLAEKRMLEKLHEGEIKTPFMKVGDTVEMKMRDEKGQNIFGTLFQKVIQAPL